VKAVQEPGDVPVSRRTAELAGRRVECGVLELALANDLQWLDRALAQVLALTARRLGAESVGLAFAGRVQR
jgi:hypothetical protein